MWTEIEIDDVRNHLSATEYTVVASRLLAPGQSNPVPAIIADVTREVRGYVQACQSNRLAASGLPAELKPAALDLIVMRLIRRLPDGVFGKTERREEAERNALTLLRAVADCRFAVEQPDTPADLALPGTAGVEVVRSRPQRSAAEKLEGL